MIITYFCGKFQQSLQKLTYGFENCNKRLQWYDAIS